jgi:hypothetical protein
MQGFIIKVIGMLLGLLTEDMLKDVVKKILDYVDAKVLGTASKIDDALVLPLTALLRKMCNIPTP